MPTYQYACTSCGHQLEAVQTFDDAPLTDCPACAGRLRKLFSSVGIVFKGSGFYRTDSRAAEAKSESGAGTPAETTPGKEPVKSTTSGTESSSGSSGSASSGGSAESTGGKTTPETSSSGRGPSKGSRTSAKAASAA